MVVLVKGVTWEAGSEAAPDTAGLLLGTRVGEKLVVVSVGGSAMRVDSSPIAVSTKEATALSSSGKGGGCLTLGQSLRSAYWSMIF